MIRHEQPTSRDPCPRAHLAGGPVQRSREAIWGGLHALPLWERSGHHRTALEKGLGIFSINWEISAEQVSINEGETKQTGAGEVVPAPGLRQTVGTLTAQLRPSLSM